jgi:hypothetical protein
LSRDRERERDTDREKAIMKYMRNLTVCNITDVVYKMWGVRHQKISCNSMQNNKFEGGQGEF